MCELISLGFTKSVEELNLCLTGTVCDMSNYL